MPLWDTDSTCTPVPTLPWRCRHPLLSKNLSAYMSQTSAGGNSQKRGTGGKSKFPTSLWPRWQLSSSRCHLGLLKQGRLCSQLLKRQCPAVRKSQRIVGRLKEQILDLINLSSSVSPPGWSGCRPLRRYHAQPAAATVSQITGQYPDKGQLIRKMQNCLPKMLLEAIFAESS